jgi:hydrogenase maturation protease
LKEPRALVAGVGNLLLGDDGFGVEVVRRLSSQPMPEDVVVADYGVRALHLAFALCDPFASIVLVDALARGGAPGALYVLDPDLDDLESSALPDAHGLHPAAVLGLARSLGARLGPVRVIGCEPLAMEEGIGLSAPVEAAVDEAVRLVHELLSKETFQ